MYMSIPQLEQLLKDRQASALNSARSVANRSARKPTAHRGRRVRVVIS
jgi:hypothetical protein